MGIMSIVKNVIEHFRKAGKTEKFVEAVMQTGVTAEQVKTAIMKMCDSQRCTNRQNTNNWRKMHGLPMRRKQKARKKHERGKRADSH
jgi:hypothetical protein